MYTFYASWLNSQSIVYKEFTANHYGQIISFSTAQEVSSDILFNVVIFLYLLHSCFLFSLFCPIYFQKIFSTVFLMWILWFSQKHKKKYFFLCIISIFVPRLTMDPSTTIDPALHSSTSSTSSSLPSSWSTSLSVSSLSHFRLTFCLLKRQIVVNKLLVQGREVLLTSISPGIWCT